MVSSSALGIKRQKTGKSLVIFFARERDLKKMEYSRPGEQV
jgi:hypothetical protein